MTITHHVFLGPHPDLPTAIRFERKVDGKTAAEYSLFLPIYTAHNNAYNVHAGASALNTGKGFENAHHASGLYNYIINFFKKLADESQATVHINERTKNQKIIEMFKKRNFEFVRYSQTENRHFFRKTFRFRTRRRTKSTKEEKTMIHKIMEENGVQPKKPLTPGK